ncbi:GNAT family N-acetyltransferase [Brevibacillus borstelensis]|uniref:GNAT family N-acetyltransferase n=1 Tax=Brevibacillus borstelensis TaxID=45462 RepID=UPI0030BC8730
MEWTRDSFPYAICDQKAFIEIDTVFALLKTSYWANERSRETVARSIESPASLCLGVYLEGRQVGFLRAVTDGATFTWVCDVIIHPEHRGKGLGKWLMEVLVDHPAVRHTNMLLGTRDAHSLYEQYGFERREMMRRPAHQVDSQ